MKYLIILILATSGLSYGNSQPVGQDYSGKLNVNLTYVGQNGKFWTIMGVIGGGLAATFLVPVDFKAFSGLGTVLGAAAAETIVCFDDCSRRTQKSKQGKVNSDLRLVELNDETISVVLQTGEVKGCSPILTHYFGYKKAEGIYELFENKLGQLPDRESNNPTATLMVESSRVVLDLHDRLYAQTSNDRGTCHWTIEADTKIELKRKD